MYTFIIVHHSAACPPHILVSLDTHHMHIILLVHQYSLVRLIYN